MLHRQTRLKNIHPTFFSRFSFLLARSPFLQIFSFVGIHKQFSLLFCWIMNIIHRWWHRNTFLAVLKAFNIHGSDFYYFHVRPACVVSGQYCERFYTIYTQQMWLNDLWWLTLGAPFAPSSPALFISYARSLAHCRLSHCVSLCAKQSFYFSYNFSHRSISIIVLVRLYSCIRALFLFTAK